MAKYIVAKVDDVPDGEHIVVDVDGRSVGVYNVGGEFYGLLNKCPHQGGPMCEGLTVGLLESTGPGEYSFDYERKLIACPWHGWEFDIKTGQSYFDPRTTRLRKFPVQVQDGQRVVGDLADEASDTTLVKGPYMAETVAVAVEEEYLVVSMRKAPAAT
jgi:3-phenylpropionate/trans-cinnamate dioxygenase ferredoxin subunit